MRLGEVIREGGWDSTVTQSTVLHPAIVPQVLKVLQKFVIDFNQYLTEKGIPPVEVGKPLGSSAHYELDSAEDPDKIYGDIDLQMIGQPVDGITSHSGFSKFWNERADEYIKSVRLPYIHAESTVGHPFVQIGPDQWVQVDFIWHEEKTREWGRIRTTPERGIKGSISGNMFSSLGELLNLSIQHAGVQLKTLDGKHTTFAAGKGKQLVTISTSPDKYMLHILTYLFMDMYGEDKVSYMKIDPLLQQYPGVIGNVTIANMVQSVKGIARSFEANKMYGKRTLAKFTSAEDFIAQFIAHFGEKIDKDINGPKRDKAETPEAKARAAEDIKKLKSGFKMVKDLFAA